MYQDSLDLPITTIQMKKTAMELNYLEIFSIQESTRWWQMLANFDENLHD